TVWQWTFRWKSVSRFTSGAKGFSRLGIVLVLVLEKRRDDESEDNRSVSSVVEPRSGVRMPHHFESRTSCATCATAPQWRLDAYRSIF
ncbi:MAG: hypothetical protein L0338_39505, partial [Acidobacteria bacterium]|nr:hypothetical protein [Acidobacteriota bacterium]